MKLNTSESYSISNKLSIEDSSSQVSLQIEAAHAGIINGNYIFYTPKALKEGSESLKKFFKPLQKGHYSKTLGYIYDSMFKPNDQVTGSKYLDNISNAKTNQELVSAVKSYYRSDDYSKNKEGFGVLVSKAKLYDKDKINNLLNKDKGYVSIAGDSENALCSICGGEIVECDHEMGQRYEGEICFAIANQLELDHISFEEIPANWKTNTLIINDSQTTSKIELIKEGIQMLTLEQLKEKASNVENMLTEFNLSKHLDAFTQVVTAASKSDFLFPKEKLVPLKDKLTVLVAKILINDLEDSEEKDTILKIVDKEYEVMFNTKTLEEALEEVNAIVEEEPVTVIEEPVIVDLPTDDKPVTVDPDNKPLEVTDADQLVLKIVDSLNQVVDTKLQEMKDKLESLLLANNTDKINQVYEDKIEALKEDLNLSKSQENQLTESLKNSLIDRIVLMKQIDVESDYFNKLKNRTVRELELTIEDFAVMPASTTAITPEPAVDNTLQVQDNLNVVVDPIDPAKAAENMSNNDDDPAVLDIQDADAIVSAIIAEKVGSGMLDKRAYATLYKDTAINHGIATAKKLHYVLKTQNKI